ncbi:MAG TPA: helix-turn-helix domain-containing protein [Lacisediminihabitans sp.]|uniref:ArsR/SmtB family transcription factor n=1 Tax=Lacisediminihabitans sp. TaxID=2787631 RepID=UPI002ED9474E
MPDYPAPDMADVDIIEVMKALSDPIRLHIVRLLADGAPRSKTMEGWGVDITKSTMAHHFRILRESGLTFTLISGRTHAIQLRRSELDARFPGLIAAVVGENSTD